MMSAIVSDEKQKKGIVYLAKNLVNNKVYIGITTRPLRTRINEHVYNSNVAKGRSRYFHHALAKYGIENFTFEVLREVELSTMEEVRKVLCELEKKYISDYKSKDKRYGYNLTDGGDGVAGYEMTSEQRQKISNIHKGKTLSDEHKARISDFMKSDKNPRLGKKQSEETKQKISKANKGKHCGSKNPMYGKRRQDLAERNKQGAKKVYQFDLKTGTLIKTWNSIREIARETGFNRSCISACCTHKATQSHGYMWSFYNNESNEKMELKRRLQDD